MSDFSDDESGIEEQFNKAAEYVQRSHTELNSSTLLELYGLYKQSTCGECNTSKPGIFNAQGRAKWNAWNVLGKMDKNKAMEVYVEKVTAIDPDWNIDKSKNANSSWVCHSLPSPSLESEIPTEDKTPFDYVKEGNLERLKTVLQKSAIDTQDEDGLGLIHWAADRNAGDILEFLLSSGADVNLQDSDEQTALHYASSCGHLDCLRILIKYGADKDLKDGDGQTCFDVAFDENIRKLLIS